MKSHLQLLLLGVFLHFAEAANDTNTTGDGLSGGAVAGIVIGVVAGVGVLGALVWFLFFKEGAIYGSVVGRGGSSGSAISTAGSASGGNHLPMMAMKVSGDDDL